MRSTSVICLAWALALLGCSDERGNSEVSETGEGAGEGDPNGDGEGDDEPSGDGDGDEEPSGDGDGDGDPSSECSSADQCVVVNDCCTCDVVLAGHEPPCPQRECFAPVCDAKGYSIAAACLLGSCTPAPVNCNANEITCEVEPPPPCADGLVRAVEGSCYGPCVPATMCEGLPFACGADTCGEGYACVNTQSGAPSRCVPLPAACEGQASCGCVGAWWGEVCLGGCGEVEGRLLCEDGG